MNKKFGIKQVVAAFLAAMVGFFITQSSFAADKEGGRSPEAAAGKRDNPEAKKAGPRDGEGAKKAGPRDGEGGVKPEGARDPNNKKPEAAPDPKQAAKLRTKEGKIFQAYDKDKSGGVTADEISAMFEGKRSRREIRKLGDLVEDLDVDGNKKELNLDEFTEYLKQRGRGRRD